MYVLIVPPPALAPQHLVFSRIAVILMNTGGTQVFVAAKEWLSNFCMNPAHMWQITHLLSPRTTGRLKSLAVRPRGCEHAVHVSCTDSVTTVVYNYANVKDRQLSHLSIPSG